MVACQRPLQDTHPELSVLVAPGFKEYRVENWRLARNGSGKIIRGVSTWPWAASWSVLVVGLLWSESTTLFRLVEAIIVLSLVWGHCSQIIYESVVVLPGHGIQLETHRGISTDILISVQRRFVPLHAVQDILINEGLRRWDVRYFLAVVTSEGSVHVIFENLLPHFPILLEVYRGIQGCMHGASNNNKS